MKRGIVTFPVAVTYDNMSHKEEVILYIYERMFLDKFVRTKLIQRMSSSESDSKTVVRCMETWPKSVLQGRHITIVTAT